MCNGACLAFGSRALLPDEVAGRDVIEVGSCNVNGSLRDVVEADGPRSYIGVDIGPGNGVDVICDVCDLVSHFGPDSFDIVISTEMLEHVEDWRGAVRNMKAILRPGGLMVITTRSPGFPLHNYPADYWRFGLSDMGQIFADMEIEMLEPDPGEPGVFMKARKRAVDLDAIELYRM